MVKTSQIKDPEEAKRWIIIGAYKAGASEKQMVRLSGLSNKVIRHILLNYQKTGRPSLPKKDPNNAKNKLIVEYDENGEMVKSDDDEDEDNDNEIDDNGSSIALKSIKTTKDLINYTKSKINKKQPSFTQVKEQQSEESYPSEQAIRGYELWTKQDDILLLNYVLNSLQNSNGWNELQVRFNGKHSARICYQRWHHIKSLLIKNMDTTI